MRTRRVLTALSAVAVLVAGACSAPTDGGADATDATEQGTTSDAETTADDETSGGDNGEPTSGSTGGSFNPISWIFDLGAGSPPGPPEYSPEGSFGALLDQDCDLALSRAAAEDNEVMAYAATVCQAATTGDGELWEEAEDLREDVDEGLNCVEDSVVASVDEVVAAHRANPTAVFDLRDPGGDGVPTCPRIDSLEPASGGPGTEVRVRGENLSRVLAVVVRDGADDVAELYPDAGEPVAVSIPPDLGSEPRNLTIVLRAEPDPWDADTATFRYVPDEEPTSDEPTSGEPTDEPTENPTGATDEPTDEPTRDPPSPEPTS